jgi:hypothetical protein
MLRMYVAQQCFGLSDEGIEDAINDSQAIRGFVGVRAWRDDAAEIPSPPRSTASPARSSTPSTVIWPRRV